MISRYRSPLASLLVLVMASGSVAQTLPAASAKPSAAAAPAKSPAPASSGATGKSVPTGASSSNPTSPTTPTGSALPPVSTTAPPTSPDGSQGSTSAGAPGAGAAPTLAPPAASSGKLGPRRTAPSLPPPTPKQLSSLTALQQELGEYQAAAKDYRNTLTMIVRHHYDEKRRRVLSALDHEIDVEQKGLADARDEAIRRLEKFVDTYSGANANVEATPDAMYRLAALYEERARADFEGDLAKTLKPAIDLYRRIIREYPKYEEISGVYYFLGHAYTDSSRLPEGQQAWRALVCNNQYSVTDDPTDSDKIAIQPLPQNHDEKFWNDWYNRHPVPLDQVGAGRRKGKAATPPPAPAPLRRPRPRRGRAVPSRATTTSYATTIRTPIPASPSRSTSSRARSRSTWPRSGGRSATTTSTRSTSPAVPTSSTAR